MSAASEMKYGDRQPPRGASSAALLLPPPPMLLLLLRACSAAAEPAVPRACECDMKEGRYSEAGRQQGGRMVEGGKEGGAGGRW